MGLSQYFSFRNAVRPEDGEGKIAAGLAAYEREHGEIPTTSDYLVWDGTDIVKTPLL